MNADSVKQLALNAGTALSVRFTLCKALKL